jgi:hypothetical protein
MRLYLLSPIILFTILCAHGQIRYGIKGGLNLSDVVINNTTSIPDAESDFRMKAGLHSGIFASIDLENKLGLAAELLYSTKGVKAIRAINLHYINLPVLLRYAISEKLFGEGGIEAGYLIAAESAYGNVGNTWNNKLDLGLDVGLQYFLLPKIIIGMRFNAGMSSVIKNRVDPTIGNNLHYQNRVLQLSVGYVLRQRKFLN